MRVFLYKMTHLGDPRLEENELIWGANDCMGEKRDYNYDAAIGIGAHGAESLMNQISGKLIWIGTKPSKKPSDNNDRGQLVIFKHFEYYGSEGGLLKNIAPALHEKIDNVRFLILDKTSPEFKEAINLINNPPASLKHSSDVVEMEGIQCPPKRKAC